MKHVGSTLTGQTAPTEMPRSQSAAGTLPGRVGADASQRAIVEWLAKQRHSDMDAAAVSRASQRGVGLRVRYEGRFPDGGPSYTVAVGCDVSLMNGADIEAAIADLRKFQTPADIRTIEEWLGELSVIVARKVGDEFEEGLRLTAFASRLSQFPADVARQAVLGKSWHFWPTWAEMEKVCNSLASPRRHMLAALERGPVEPDPPPRPPTQEERDRINALIAELFPAASQSDRDRAVNEALSGNCMRGNPE